MLFIQQDYDVNIGVFAPVLPHGYDTVLKQEQLQSNSASKTFKFWKDVFWFLWLMSTFGQ